MSRSKWKFFYVPKIILQSNKSKKNIIYINDRSCIITPNLVGSLIGVYNGKKYHKIIINKNMVGQKIGEFSSTRSIHYKKK